MPAPGCPQHGAAEDGEMELGDGRRRHFAAALPGDGPALGSVIRATFRPVARTLDVKTNQRPAAIADFLASPAGTPWGAAT